MDDEPMWAADRVIALTLDSAITIPETATEFAIKETLKMKPPVTPSNLSMQRNVEYPKALHYWVNSIRSENDY
ncbi:hypothetical protein Tco_0020938 [Tanacetum coccineum]